MRVCTSAYVLKQEDQLMSLRQRLGSEKLALKHIFVRRYEWQAVAWHRH